VNCYDHSEVLCKTHIENMLQLMFPSSAAGVMMGEAHTTLHTEPCTESSEAHLQNYSQRRKLIT